MRRPRARPYRDARRARGSRSIRGARMASMAAQSSRAHGANPTGIILRRGGRLPSRFESLAADDAGAFPHDNQLTGGDVFDLLLTAVRPAYLDGGFRFRAQPEMQAAVVNREVGRL